MSNDRSGLPGIWTAAMHLVCVSVGAPGPIQAPNAAPDAASDTAPSSAEADESLADMLVSPLVGEFSSGAAFFLGMSNTLLRQPVDRLTEADRKSTRLNSSHRCISYAVFCL